MKKPPISDIFYVFLLLVVSSGTAIWLYYDLLLIGVLITGFFIVLVRRIHVGSPRLIVLPTLVLLFYSFIELLMTGSVLYSIYLRLFTALIAVYLGFIMVPRFWEIVEKWLYFLAWTSLVLFPLQVFGGDAFLSIAKQFSGLITPSLAGMHDYYLIIFNVDNSFMLYGDIRNSGFMWEPGAFSMMMVLAILLLYLREGIGRKNLKKYFLYSIVIITTVSTAGYLALFLSLFLLVPRQNKLLLVSISLIILTAFLFALVSFDFLLPKIDKQFFAADEIIVNEGAYATTGIRSLGRFGSIIAATKTIESSPLFGIGMNDDYFFKGGYVTFRYTSGLGDVLAKMGLAGILLLFYNLRNFFFGLARRWDSKLSGFEQFMMVVIFFVFFFSNTAVFFPLFIGMQVYHLRTDNHGQNRK